MSNRQFEPHAEVPFCSVSASGRYASGISLSALVVPPDGLDPTGKLDYEGGMIWK